MTLNYFFFFSYDNYWSQERTKPPVLQKRPWRPFDYVQFQLVDIEDSLTAQSCLFSHFIDSTITTSRRKIIVAICVDLTSFNSFQFEELLGKWCLEALYSLPNHHLEIIAMSGDSGGNDEKVSVIKFPFVL